MTASKLLTLLIAITVTATGVAMAAMSALDRGGAPADKALLVMMSIVITVLAHLLLSITRNKLAWVVWAGCLTVTIYGHAAFFVNAGIRAGESRAQNSMQSRDADDQIAIVTHALDGIVARPVTVVAAELAVTRGYRKRLALKNEMHEAERAVRLFEQLLTLKGNASNGRVTQSHDRVTTLLSGVTGGNEAQISLLISLFLACLIELVGALLWYEVLKESSGRVESSPRNVVESQQTFELVQQTTVEEDPQLVKVVQAIKAGACRPTVSSIRNFSSCSQAKALEMRRQLMSIIKVSPESSMA